MTDKPNTIRDIMNGNSRVSPVVSMVRSLKASDVHYTNEHHLQLMIQAEKRSIMDAYIQGVIDGAEEILDRETIEADALAYYESTYQNQ